MHFADEAGHVAGAIEMVGDRLVGEGPGDRVVIRAVIVCVESGEQRGARGHAHRIRAIRAVEPHAGAAQPVEVRCLPYGAAIDAHPLRLMLTPPSPPDSPPPPS